MKKLILLSILSFLLVVKSFSQEYYQLDEMFLDADAWFFYEDYQEALPLFLRVLEADSLNYNVMYKIGFCYLHIPGQKAKSIEYLEKAINKITLNYKNNTYNERLAPLDALFYLGNAYLVNNRIDEAIDAYSGFQNKISRSKKIANKDIYDLDYLNRQFDACRNALQLQYKPVNFIAANIGRPINSRFNEYNAIVSGDGSTLVFTVSLKFYDGIFYAKKTDGKWGYPINLMGQLGIDDNSATTGLSYDGTELYIYRDDDFDGNIYVSFFKDGIWSKVKKLGENINTKYWESHASLSPDNQKLYFVSNKEGGQGDLDIYVSERLTDTTWGPAKNLGDLINTRWNENTPFLTPDGKRLFFSSEGLQGMGGYDIYYSELVDEKWTEPVNLGYPINTTDDDIFFAPDEDGSFAYCSQFSKKGFGGQDIYRFQLFNIPDYNNVLVEGIVTYDNNINKNKQDFSINIINKTNQDTIAVLKPEKDKLGYQYQTPLGVNHLVYESPKDEETNDQYFISTFYDIKDAYQEFIDPSKLADLTKKDTIPKIEVENNYYETVSDQENVKIKLSLQEGNKLIVNTFYKDKLINSEEFEIKKEDFIYEYKPLAGKSKIKFKIIDKNNNVKTEEVTVSYIPKDLVAELSIDDQIISLSENGNKTVKIKLSVEKGSKLFVETFVDDKLINTEKFNIRKEDFVYEFEPKGDKSKLNFKIIDKNNNVKNEEVIVSHKPISKDFADLITGINTFNNKSFRNLLESSEVVSAKTNTDFVNILYNKAKSLGLSKEQIQTLILTLALNSTNDTQKFILELLKISSGDLKVVLDSIYNNFQNFHSNLDVIEELKLKSKSYNYTINDIVALLEDYLKQSDISHEKLIARAEYILNTNISNILSNIDASIDITNLDEFKRYLINKNIYTREELEQIFSLLEALALVSLKEEISEEEITEPVAQKVPRKKKNWLISFIVICFVSLGLIILFFNRRKNKANKKRNI